MTGVLIYIRRGKFRQTQREDSHIKIETDSGYAAPTREHLG